MEKETGIFTLRDQESSISDQEVSNSELMLAFWAMAISAKSSTCSSTFLIAQDFRSVGTKNWWLFFALDSNPRQQISDDKQLWEILSAQCYVRGN